MLLNYNTTNFNRATEDDIIQKLKSSLLHELHPLHIKKKPTNVDVEIVPAEGSYSIPDEGS
jgi:hypothetical protein